MGVAPRPAEKRRDYIQELTRYNIETGQLTSATGAWPNPAGLAELIDFCGQCYAVIRDLVRDAFEVQSNRR